MKTDNHLLAKIGQYALIKNNEGHLLVLERARSKTWSLPGGRLDNAEAWDSAFIREIKEELNLDVVEMKPFTTNILTDPYQTKYCIYFDTSIKNFDDIKISSEHSNFKWIGSSELAKIEFEDEQVLKVVSDFLNTQTKFKVGVFGVIFDTDKKVLLCHRNDYDLWNLPGGRLERNESPWDGVVREVREETGLNVRVVKLIGVYSKPDKDEIVFSFLCEKESGEITTTDEARSVEFFDFEKLPPKTVPKQVERIEDALKNYPEAITKNQHGKSSIELIKEGKL